MSMIAIAGGHGQVALHLTRLLAERGDDVVSLVRNPDHRGDVEAAGGRPVVLDLEEASVDALARELDALDAVVFAAGAGPGSGAARKETVDYAAAVLLRDAALRAGVQRYVMVSAMGTDDPPQGDDVFEVYLRAKARADAAVAASDLAWTIVRPGRLSDDPPTGEVRLDRHVPRGAISRADVAAVVAAVLRRPDTAGHVLEVVAGEDDIDQALDHLVAGGPRDLPR